jgi:hypothetical protein
MYTISEAASQERFLSHCKKLSATVWGSVGVAGEPRWGARTLVSADSDQARLGKNEGNAECVSPLADVRRGGGILSSGDRGLTASPGPPLAFLCVPVREGTTMSVHSP